MRYTGNEGVGGLDITEDQRAFHLKEYESLRAELLTLVNNIFTLAKYTVVATAAIYVFMFSYKAIDPVSIHPQTAVFRFAFLIPFIIACFGSILANGQCREVNWISIYLMQIEKSLGYIPDLGWEHHKFSWSHPGFYSDIIRPLYKQWVPKNIDAIQKKYIFLWPPWHGFWAGFIILNLIVGSLSALSVSDPARSPAVSQPPSNAEPSVGRKG